MHIVLPKKEKKKYLHKCKNNLSTEVLNLTKNNSKEREKETQKEKNKENLLNKTLSNQKSAKTISKNTFLGKYSHKMHISDFSDVKKKSRLKTEQNETKSSTKKEIVRMKTEVNDVLDLYGQSPYAISIKKKKVAGTRNLLDHHHQYPSLIRKST